MDYDEMTLAIKLKAGDQVWVKYLNDDGHNWQSAYKHSAYFVGLLLYKT